jgi:hypothetical protein
LEVIANLKYGRGKIFVQIPYLAPTLIQESIFPRLARPKYIVSDLRPTLLKEFKTYSNQTLCYLLFFYSTVIKLPAL